VENHSGADIHPAPRGGPHARTGGCALKEAVTPWTAHTGADNWQELQSVERSPCQSRFSGRTCDPMGDPHWSSQFLKDSASWKGPKLV